jgi:hypothetical protein
LFTNEQIQGIGVHLEKLTVAYPVNKLLALCGNLRLIIVSASGRYWQDKYISDYCLLCDFLLNIILPSVSWFFQVISLTQISLTKYFMNL